MKYLGKPLHLLALSLLLSNMIYSQSSSYFPALSNAKLIQKVLIEKTTYFQRFAYFYLTPDSVDAFWVLLKSGEWMISLKYPHTDLFSSAGVSFLPSYLGIVAQHPKAFIPPLIRKENPLYSYALSARIPYLPDSNGYILPNALPYKEGLYKEGEYFDTTWAKQIHPDQFPSLYLVMYIGVTSKRGPEKELLEEFYYFFPLRIRGAIQEGIYVERIIRTPSEYQLQLRLLPFPVSIFRHYPFLTPPPVSENEFTIDVLNPMPFQVKEGTYIGFYPFPCNEEYSILTKDAKWTFSYFTRENGKFYLNLLFEGGVLDSFCLALRLDVYSAQQPRDTISLLTPFPGDQSLLQSSYQLHYNVAQFLRQWNVVSKGRKFPILLRINQYEKRIELTLE